MTRSGSPSFRPPTRDDAVALATMARASFAETFDAKISPPALLSYLDRAYAGGGQMEVDLEAGSGVDWQATWVDDFPVGFAKVSALTLATAEITCPVAPGAAELRQCYVTAAWQGSGVAATLMAWALAAARARGAPEIYLAVFDDNYRAKAFYARYGFAEVGRCDFVTGDQVHDDRIWRALL